MAGAGRNTEPSADVRAPGAAEHRVRNLAAAALIFALVAALVMILWLSWSIAGMMVRVPRHVTQVTPAERGIPHWEAITLTSFDGVTLVGWYVPAGEADAVVIVLHGLGANRSAVLAQAAELVAQGYGVLLYDQRGHGVSGGKTPTFGYHEWRDVESALAFLQTRGVERVGVLGESLGGATAILAGAHLSALRVVVAEAPYADVAATLYDNIGRSTRLPPALLAPLALTIAQAEAGAAFTDSRPVDFIGRIAPRPVLLLHGERDALIAPSSSQQLYEAAGEPRQLVWFPDAQHAGLLGADPQRWRSAVLPFLDHYLRAAP